MKGQNSQLEQIQQSFIRSASLLGDYQLISKAELGNGYCQAEANNDEQMKSAYFSAIVLRYWYWIFKWVDSCKSLHLQIEDFVDWIVDCVNDSLYYKSWMPLNPDGTPNQHVKLLEDGSLDPNAFDKSMNNFLGFKRNKEYQASNKDKRKSHALSYSLDASKDENGDSALDFVGAVETPDYANGVESIINQFLKQDRTIEALILDGICYHDSFKEEVETKKISYEVENQETGEVEIETEKISSYSNTFDARKLVKHLNEIDEAFMNNYFNLKYELSDEQKENTLNKLKSLNNTKLYNYIKKTLINVKSNKELLSYLVH